MFSILIIEMKNQHWIFLFGFLFNVANSQSCVYKPCWCYGNYTACNRLGLSDVPYLVGSGVVTDLSLDTNHITHIPSNRLPPNIQRLSMMDNPLTSIDELAFDDSINTLNSVTLSKANFTKLPNAFGRLRRLALLQISNSRVSDWNAKVMETIGATVNSLTLQDCDLVSWPDWLQRFTNLTELSLQINSLSTIPDNGLDSVAITLTSLDLQNNTLTSVPKAFSKLIVLQNLYLQYNKISDVTWLPSKSKLTIFYIDNNKLYDADQFSKALLPYTNSLEGLSTNHNNFHKLPKLGFLQQVTYLDFADNQISDSISGDLPANLDGLTLYDNNFPSIPKVLMTLQGVTTVVLSNNMVTQIRDFEFPPWATGAEFGYNFITELTDNSFPPNSSLRYINFNNNPMYKISNQAFQNVPLMSYLNVQSSHLTRLPLGLLSGKGLTSIDFSDCSYLVCTCEERGLAPLIASLDQYSVIGSCGRTEIRYFFTTLAKDCP